MDVSTLAIERIPVGVAWPAPSSHTAAELSSAMPPPGARGLLNMGEATWQLPSGEVTTDCFLLGFYTAISWLCNNTSLFFSFKWSLEPDVGISVS